MGRDVADLARQIPRSRGRLLCDCRAGQLPADRKVCSGGLNGSAQESLLPLKKAVRLSGKDRATITQVVFSNRVLGLCLEEGKTARNIAVNVRFRIDPDMLAHFVVEEFVHAQQMLDRVDFAAQRSQFAYDERPYEIQAKRIATEIFGYDPDEYVPTIRREEPDGVLYDRAE